ncbi:transposable element Tcb1 transposase [Trichonephila clavipes]|uniref:Transposable element Tcb1 transposase n=2 Tax=Trichonephila clavipes TaxID=2585209 RepID=A0A8X6SLA8_TRICX|nr:transposable element Tcb1 transposase [Trichonephila clavipes]
MSSRHHIDDFMRGRIIGKIEEGRKITDVAREFDIAHSVVSRLWKSFKTTGMCSRRHGGGRVRSTTPAEDRYIVLSAKRNRRTTAQQVANQFLAASGKQISRKTVARRLRGGGLYARRPVVCVSLTRQHRTARLQWFREHHNWTEQDWACVLLSDESRFSLSSDCRRQLIWRESGTAYRPENIQEKDRYPTCSIMVWASIMINGRTRLHVVANGTMTGQRYIDEVLLPHVRLFRGAVGDKFVFMDDNATCHRTLAVQDCLDSEDIQRLVWPARSPDLNPIENVWDALGRQVAGRNYPPTNKNTLIRALTEEWDKLPQQLLNNVVQNDLSKRSNNYTKLLHILSYIFRFLHKFRNPSAKRSGQLDYSEVNETELCLIKYLQSSAFKQEIEALAKAGCNFKKRQTFFSLNPFLDDNPILRVGEWLQNSDLTYSQKHPAILPVNHLLTQLHCWPP